MAKGYEAVLHYGKFELPVYMSGDPQLLIYMMKPEPFGQPIIEMSQNKLVKLVFRQYKPRDRHGHSWDYMYAGEE